MHCDGKKVTIHLTNTCKFKLVKITVALKLGGECFTKSHAESIYFLIYGQTNSRYYESWSSRAKVVYISQH